MLAGIPDAMLGETIHAIVVPRAGVVVDAQALRAWLTARIERYKVPDTIHFHHTLPCGPTGKADRRAAAAIMMAALATGRDST
ncbi:MAG: hypothetical protein HY056_14640 [Proteobacteria bacterium]|nr:hypothetical protein [Pseudomonadota bacterium]